MKLIKGSLRSRLLAITFLALLPAVGVLSANVWFEYQQQRREVEEQALFSAQVLLDEQSEVIENTRHFLISLSRRNELQNLHSPACVSALRESVPLSAYIVNLGVPDTSGDLHCNATPLSGPVNVADRPYFQQTISQKAFSVGQFQLDRATGVTSVNFAYPVYRQGGGLVGAVVAVVSLDWWSQRLAKLGLPDDAQAFIIDAGQKVIASGYQDMITTKMEPLTGNELALTRLGISEFTDNQGTKRLAVSLPLELNGKDSGIRFVVSLTTEQAYESAYHYLLRSSAFLLLGYVLFIVLLWYGFANNVLKPVYALLKTSKQYIESVDDRDGTSLDQMESFYLRFKEVLKEQERLKTDLIQSQSELTETCQRLNYLLDHSPFGVVEWDAQLRICRWSPECERIFMVATQDVENRMITQLPPAVRTHFTGLERHLKAFLSGSNSRKSWEAKLYAEGGNERVLRWRFASIDHQGGTASGVLGMFENVTQQVEYQREIEYHARFDSLTGLPNRYAVLQQISDYISAGQSFTLALADICDFKRVNDHYGHEFGDMLLVELAERGLAQLRRGEGLSRWGGNEFLFVVPSADTDYALERLGALRAVFAEPLEVGHRTYTPQVVCGVASSAMVSEEAGEIIRCADLAVYFAKRERAAVRVYDPSFAKIGSAQFEMLAELRNALPRGELELYFQPIFATRTGRFESAEALLRWHHPDRGMVSPAEFIPLAEESGLIVPIGNWVLEQSIAQMSRWRSEGIELNDIAVNVSALQLNDPNLVDYVTGLFEKYQFAPSLLTIEVTETSLLSSQQDVIDKITQLKDIGIKIALDDFGTGYSSLSYLNELPLTKLKVDRSFIKRIGDKDKEVLLDAIFIIAHGLKLQVVAEGIEEHSQVEYLRSRECEFCQGYYYSKPLCAPEFELLIQKDTCTRPVQ